MQSNNWLRALLLFFLAAFVALGCSSMGHQREQYLASHPELPAQFKQAISQGQVLKKMTKDMVTVAWGRPLRIEEPADTSLADEVWIYSLSADVPATCLCFKDGLVDHWEQPCSRELVSTEHRQPEGAMVRPIIDDKPPEPLAEPSKGSPSNPR